MFLHHLSIFRMKKKLASYLAMACAGRNQERRR
jgi:hypothetical protein